MPYKHIPVMLNEVIYHLNCTPGKVYVDGTLGGSGHARAICENIVPDGMLIGIDQDNDAVQNAKEVLKPFERNTHLVNDNFVNLPTILSRLNVMAVDGILLDLGLSLDQLKYSGRGFGFGKDEPLDMRMDTTSVTKAEDLINTLEEEKLATIFREYGEERWARHIARSIGAARKLEPIKSSKRLAELVCQAVPAKASFQQRIHPATRTFMSLRIAVNRELERLDAFMKNVATFLNPKGRLCVVSFHSLEDRIVKQNIRELEGQCLCPPDFPKCICNKKKKVRSLTKKVLRPQQEEIAINPMSRSAKLRVAEKI